MKFKLLAAKSHLAANNVNACIRLLEGEDGSPQQDSSTTLLAEKYIVLAQAYEVMEDKQQSVAYLQMALKVDCQQVNAFNKLLSNFLMSKDDCIRLLMGMSFGAETLWLRDYYTSRIELEIRSKEN